MKNLISTFLALIVTNLVIGQTIEIQQGAKYRLDNQLYFKGWNGTSATEDSVLVCSKNKIKVTRTIGELAIVKIKTTYSYSSGSSVTCETGANKANTYTIKKSILSNNVTIPEWQPQYGILSVPFKYDMSNSRVYPGGQIGGLFGVQKRLNWTPTESMSWFFVGTAGYSRIALNNTNIQNVDPSNTTFADAFTYGAATGIQISRFQIMLVKGWDNFSVNSEKKKISWISIGFGFGFIKPPTE